MTLLDLRDRIRTKAIAAGLSYTEIETLFDVNELLNQTMPCLLWQYGGETNNFEDSETEMSLNVYLLTNFPDSVKSESADYQRDYIVTQINALRNFFITWLKLMPFDGDDYLEILTTDEIPIAQRLSIDSFLSIEFRVNIRLKRNFCIDPEEITPLDQVQVYFNSVLKYTQACNVDLQLTLKNQDGDDIDATYTGYDIVVTQPVPADASVNNSDSSYTASVASGGTLVLPDEAITLNSAAFITKPSKKDQDILLKDVSGTTITPVSLAGNTITILDAVKDWDIIIGYSTGDITSTQTMRRAGTITSITTTLTISTTTINGGAVSTPITIALNDILEITYTAAPSDGTIILEGTYV